jgi:kynurenine formamidase
LINVLRRTGTAVLAGCLLFGGGILTATLIGSNGPAASAGAPFVPADFGRAVFLSHINNPRTTPGFPGDPAFKTSVPFTVPRDGFYLQYVKEGEHTGTHWGAPCHFHVGAACAPKLDPRDLILPAAVVDIRKQVHRNVDYRATVADLKAWERRYGPLPKGAAVILHTGCSKFWAKGHRPRARTYYNCGTGRRGFHQPGFSLAAVKWLIRRGVLAKRGALGTDTFGPDPATDAHFRESSLVFHRHRIDLENLTHVELLPPTGAWVVVGGPRNSHGSGSPATIYGLLPSPRAQAGETAPSS